MTLFGHGIIKEPWQQVNWVLADFKPRIENTNCEISGVETLCSCMYEACECELFRKIKKYILIFIIYCFAK